MFFGLPTFTAQKVDAVADSTHMKRSRLDSGIGHFQNDLFLNDASCFPLARMLFQESFVSEAGGSARCAQFPQKALCGGIPGDGFGILGTVLEPFCGKLLPKVDKPVKN